MHALDALARNKQTTRAHAHAHTCTRTRRIYIQTHRIGVKTWQRHSKQRHAHSPRFDTPAVVVAVVGCDAGRMQ